MYFTRSVFELNAIGFDKDTPQKRFMQPFRPVEVIGVNGNLTRYEKRGAKTAENGRKAFAGT
ncbi:MAG: hypothetical protein IPJ82_01675 [Lewinellaceae bacterium]|nr:hypothetical protein [Lewinellaceae bacterium]